MYNINLSTAVAVKGDNAYFSALYHNALLRMNMQTEKTEYLCSFEKEKKIIGIHGKSFCYKELVWFIPQYGEYIACYDIDANKMEYIDVPGKIYGRPCMEKYCLDNQGERILPKYSDAGWIDGENIYLVPAATDTALILNVKTKKISKTFHLTYHENEYFGCGTYYEGKIWMAPYEGHHLISLDICTNEIQRIDCEREQGIFYGICGYRERIWFSSLTDKGVMFWDIQEKKYGELPCMDMDFKYGKRTYRDIVKYSDTLWLFPWEAEKIIFLDNEKQLFVEYESKVKQGFGVMLEVDMCKDSMYAVSYSHNYMICLHKDNFRYEIYTPKISISQLYDILNCNHGEEALCMLMEHYHGGMPEKDLGITDYISLSVLHGLSMNKRSEAEYELKNLTGKIGQACFAVMKEEK